MKIPQMHFVSLETPDVEGIFLDDRPGLFLRLGEQNVKPHRVAAGGELSQRTRREELSRMLGLELNFR